MAASCPIRAESEALEEVAGQSAVAIGMGAAYAARLAGLSLEIGACLAPMMISEPDLAHEVFSQVRPQHQVLASLFIVFLGMLLNIEVYALTVLGLGETAADPSCGVGIIGL